MNEENAEGDIEESIESEEEEGTEEEETEEQEEEKAGGWATVTHEVSFLRDSEVHILGMYPNNWCHSQPAVTQTSDK